MANLPSGMYTGWTGTGAALGDAVHYLVQGSEARADAGKFIVLMSDGHANKPSGNGPGYADLRLETPQPMTSRCTRSAWATEPTWF